MSGNFDNDLNHLSKELEDTVDAEREARLEAERAERRTRATLCTAIASTNVHVVAGVKLDQIPTPDLEVINGTLSNYGGVNGGSQFAVCSYVTGDGDKAYRLTRRNTLTPDISTEPFHPATDRV